jgi:hypothetical protein
MHWCADLGVVVAASNDAVNPARLGRKSCKGPRIRVFLLGIFWECGAQHLEAEGQKVSSEGGTVHVLGNPYSTIDARDRCHGLAMLDTAKHTIASQMPCTLY